MAEEAKKIAPKKTYYVENVVRRVGSRLHRAKSATRHRFKLYIGPQRILRNQKLPLNEEQFELYKDKIHKMVLDGQAALHLPDGMRITSLPDGRLVYRRKDGAVKIDEAPQPKQAPPKAAKAPEKTPEPPPVKAEAPEVEVIEEPVSDVEPVEEPKAKKSSYKGKTSKRKKD